ncbi:3-oxoacyl-ACP reductase FabG [Acinetobacter seifertii]|uniref:3-oxoacyl-ACP reductase family protein n=1 Tax=Acinetobacter seifertii TaxID=1530123 RepID=UPI0015803929|nr:3-oxoacyl-ACP reductase family protein [Acinetobacter seifertii]NUG12997.1 3-oxoacyl-ACP reductase FabG [Acinetobacter seifertii]
MNNTLSHDLGNKIAFVQGGSRGIGAAIVSELAEQGATVAFTYANSEQAAHQLADELNANGLKVIALKADSSSPEQIVAAIDHVVSAYGKIDILVNNVGIFIMNKIQDVTLDEIDKMIAVNIKSVIVAANEVLKHMPDYGRIINIGSINAERVPTEGLTLYSMTKSAIKGLTKGMARDLGDRFITVNNIQPGPVDTDMNPADGDMASSLIDIMAIKRYGHKSEIAALVSWLCSEHAGYITGANINIDGGYGI